MGSIYSLTQKALNTDVSCSVKSLQKAAGAVESAAKKVTEPEKMATEVCSSAASAAAKAKALAGLEELKKHGVIDEKIGKICKELIRKTKDIKKMEVAIDIEKPKYKY